MISDQKRSNLTFCQKRDHRLASHGKTEWNAPKRGPLDEKWLLSIFSKTVDFRAKIPFSLFFSNSEED